MVKAAAVTEAQLDVVRLALSQRDPWPALREVL